MSTNNRMYMGIDIKRIARQMLAKAWLIVLMTVAGALAGLLAYTIYSNVKSGNTVYKISNDYYIFLDYTDYPEGPDYYNAYTWDGILRDDPIVEYALTLTTNVTKQQILDSVKGEILGDYRILTVIVKGTDPKLIQEISDAYKQALPHFAEEIDMIEHIDLWTDSAMVEYDEYTKDGNAAFLGGLIGLLLSLFGLLLFYVIDDGIYTERDWAGRYPDIPYLGAMGSKEAELNIEHILGTLDGCHILKISDFEFNKDVFDAMKASKGVVLDVRHGKDKGEIIDKVVFTLAKQGIKVKGALFN